ncbi:hypothetical protein N657DRAFT_649732 [Parathielavia appendiculata]|uniref:Uncharacterized protein n=1 Tax=Parathielavia appendiculata TaxID=2587402 RepID=A0AAN6TSM8_9PEZI|nr:hypothetical protein N657DRAFT_649732 [Parathielavia appendiculata]
MLARSVLALEAGSALAVHIHVTIRLLTTVWREGLTFQDHSQYTLHPGTMAQIGSGTLVLYRPPSPSSYRTELLRCNRHASEVVPLEPVIEDDPREHLTRLASLGGVVQLTRPPDTQKNRKCFRCWAKKYKVGCPVAYLSAYVG